jgi:hypothetical protein
MNKIWVLAYEGGIIPDDVVSYAIAEDGEVIAAHESSSESWARHDMISAGWKEEQYQKKYPGGYEVIWVGLQDPSDYPGLQGAIDANKALGIAAKKAVGVE